MPSARYFATLSAAAAAVIFGILSSVPAFKTPLLQPPACLAQPSSVTYSFLSTPLNEALCKLNTSFFAAMSRPGGALFFQYFGGAFVTAVLLAVYESFRPSSRRSASKKATGSVEGFGMHLGLAQLATPALAVGQVITAGLALPIYYAFVAFSTPKHWRRAHHKIDIGDEVFVPPQERVLRQEPHKHSIQYKANVPRSSFLYTTVISTAVGLMIPSIYVEVQRSAAGPGSATTTLYHALAAWQLYPLYMLIINLAVPPLLRRSFTAVAPTRGIVLVASLGIVASLKTQVDLFRGMQTIPLADVFLCNFDRKVLLSDAEDLSTAIHVLFLADLALVVITTASQVILAAAHKTGAGAGGKLAYLLAVALGSVVAGPGAAIMVLWAYGEFAAIQHAREREEVAAKEHAAKMMGKR